MKRKIVTAVALMLAASWAHAESSSTPPPADTVREILLLPQGTKRTAKLETQAVASLVDELSKDGRWKVSVASRKVRKGLARLMRRCKNLSTKSCVTQVRRQTDAPYLLVAVFQAAKKTTKLRLTLHSIAEAGEPLRRDGTLRASSSTADTRALGSALLTSLAERLRVDDNPPAGVAQVAPADELEPELAALPPPVASQDPPIVPKPPPPAPVVADSPHAAAQAAAKSSGSVGEVPPAGEVWDAGRDDPAILHAEAIDAELDGRFDTALDLLGSALVLLPANEAMAFDRARIALENRSARLEEASSHFMAIAPTTEPSRRLRGYILASQGRSPGDDPYLSGTERAVVSRDGGLSLQQSFAPVTQPGVGRGRLSTFVRVATQLDSNETSLPDDSPTFDRGYKIATMGNLTLAPVATMKGFEVNITGMLTPHLNDRQTLGLLDVGAATLSSALTIDRKTWTVRTSLGTSQVALNALESPLDSHFMQTLDARLEARLRLRAVWLGTFMALSLRDFIFGNLEGTADDRDGPAADAGFTLQSKQYGFDLSARVGAQLEAAQGRHHQERGALAAVSLRRDLGPVTLKAALDYRARYYERGRRPEEDGQRWRQRTEYRWSPSIDASFDVADGYSLFVAYAYTSNQSNAGFTYTKHLAQTGVTARW